MFRRLREGSLKLEDVGLREMPVSGKVLDEPILDVSPKLEATDKYIGWEEARGVCNLIKDEIEEIERITLRVNQIITEGAKRTGLFNEDGKVEFGFEEGRNLILVDALGTLDECRFTYKGMSVSKEVARIYHRKASWYKDVELAKKQDKHNWKALVKSLPPPLPKELANFVSIVYKAYTNELAGRKWFNAPPLKEVLNGIGDLT